MMLGEVAPGGVGSGLYGMLVLAVITVFVAGLMVGPHAGVPRQAARPAGDDPLLAVHPHHPGARAHRHRAWPWRCPRAATSLLNAGPHGLSEALYAFTSAGNNNGSAFAGLSANTPFYNIALGLAMAFGRFLPIVFVLALAGRLAAQGRARRPPAPSRPTGRCSSGCCPPSSSSSSASPTSRRSSLGPLAEGL